jgi:hypothetical protein
MDVNTTAGGIVVGIGLVNAGTTATWTGPTEDFDGAIESGVAVFSGASAATASASTPLTVTCDWATTGNMSAQRHEIFEDRG